MQCVVISSLTTYEGSDRDFAKEEEESHNTILHSSPVWDNQLTLPLSMLIALT